MKSQQIIILGVGNILFTDEGFGIRVVEKLNRLYEFPDNVSLVDGGVQGLNLLGVMFEANYLIVVDAIKNKGNPGSLYRLKGDAIPQGIRAKNSLHQVDLLEALTLFRALDKVPETVILGVEPKDIETPCVELTPTTRVKVDQVMDMVLSELERLGASYHKRDHHHFSK